MKMNKNKNKLKCVFFDLDGTITAYKNDKLETWRKALEIAYPSDLHEPHLHLANEICRLSDKIWSSEDRNDIYRLNPQQTRIEIVERVFRENDIYPEELGHGSNQEEFKLSESVVAAFHLQQMKNLRTTKGARSTFEVILSLGIRLGIITDGELRFQMAKIDALELREYFEFIQIESSAGVGKSSLAAYKMALSKNHCAPHEAIMIGDSYTRDVENAVKSGMHAAWFADTNRSMRSDVLKPKNVYIISHISDIVPIVRYLNQG